MRQVLLVSWLISTLILLSACNVNPGRESVPPPAYVVVPFTDLVLEELDQTALAEPGIPGCRLSDLRPFGWKEVDSGLVDIRTPEEYAIQTESLYLEGYRDYQQTLVEYMDRNPSTLELSYEEFLATCNVFPHVDFEQYSVLGAQAAGTGCTVTFEKDVWRDDQSKTVLYEITVIEEGACELVSHDRNLILVPRIPPDYGVEFSMSDQ